MNKYGFTLGTQNSNCRWIKMGQNWYQWVCFKGGLSGSYEFYTGYYKTPAGKMMYDSTMAGVPCRQRTAAPNYTQAPQTTVAGAANVNANANDSAMPYAPPLPYCDQVSFIDKAINWVQENPILAAAAGFAAYKVFYK